MTYSQLAPVSQNEVVDYYSSRWKSLDKEKIRRAFRDLDPRLLWSPIYDKWFIWADYGSEGVVRYVKSL